MKILLYNTCYCIGYGEPRKSKYEKLWKYIYSDISTLTQLIDFVNSENPDVLALVETDSGSIRSRLINQPEIIVRQSGFSSGFYKTKYGPTLIQSILPIFKHQCNAVFTKSHNARFDCGFFEATGEWGSKNLYLQCAIHPKIDLFVLHLPLDKKGRAEQLDELANMVKKCDNEVIVAGDFNIFDGYSEIEYLMRECNLQSANVQNTPTYPSWKPEKEIDLFLTTPGIKVNKFEALDIHLSDHLPILVDVEVLR